jgi:hypothetical protein
VAEEIKSDPTDEQIFGGRAWPNTTTIAECVASVSVVFPRHLLLWVARMREKDFDGATNECSNLRRIVARVEAYQRMVQRRGPAKGEKPDETNPGSAR